MHGHLRWTWLVVWACGWCWASVGQAAEPATTRPSFAVVGRITDGDGKPIEGVEVWASCGWGTLLPTGNTSSGRDGRYRLTFGPGMHLQRDGHWAVGTQAATISARREGFFEKNLGRQGDLLMSDEPSPALGKAAGIVRPNQPYQVDFVMLPAASVEGQLLDDKGQPIADRVLYLSGKELPPSCSVLASARADKEGRFRFGSIPTGRDLWLEMSLPGQRRDLVSSEIRFDKPTAYRFRVAQTKAADGQQTLAATPLPMESTRP